MEAKFRQFRMVCVNFGAKCMLACVSQHYLDRNIRAIEGLRPVARDEENDTKKCTLHSKANIKSNFGTIIIRA
jgi:hypothetical protein